MSSTNYFYNDGIGLDSYYFLSSNIFALVDQDIVLTNAVSNIRQSISNINPTNVDAQISNLQMRDSNFDFITSNLRVAISNNSNAIVSLSNSGTGGGSNYDTQISNLQNKDIQLNNLITLLQLKDSNLDLNITSLNSGISNNSNLISILSTKEFNDVFNLNSGISNNQININSNLNVINNTILSLSNYCLNSQEQADISNINLGFSNLSTSVSNNSNLINSNNLKTLADTSNLNLGISNLIISTNSFSNVVSNNLTIINSNISSNINSITLLTSKEVADVSNINFGISNNLTSINTNTGNITILNSLYSTAQMDILGLSSNSSNYAFKTDVVSLNNGISNLSILSSNFTSNTANIAGDVFNLNNGISNLSQLSSNYSYQTQIGSLNNYASNNSASLSNINAGISNNSNSLSGLSAYSSNFALSSALISSIASLNAYDSNNSLSLSNINTGISNNNTLINNNSSAISGLSVYSSNFAFQTQVTSLNNYASNNSLSLSNINSGISNNSLSIFNNSSAISSLSLATSNFALQSNFVTLSNLASNNIVSFNTAFSNNWQAISALSVNSSNYSFKTDIISLNNYASNNSASISNLNQGISNNTSSLSNYTALTLFNGSVTTINNSLSNNSNNIAINSNNIMNNKSDINGLSATLSNFSTNSNIVSINASISNLFMNDSNLNLGISNLSTLSSNYALQSVLASSLASLNSYDSNNSLSLSNLNLGISNLSSLSSNYTLQTNFVLLSNVVSGNITSFNTATSNNWNAISALSVDSSNYAYLTQITSLNNYASNNSLSLSNINLGVSNLSSLSSNYATSNNIMTMTQKTFDFNANTFTNWPTVMGPGTSNYYLNDQPLGAILDYAGSNAPANWLLCYGQLISRTTYSNLFNVIGTTYGVGDGSTTFALPDFRGRVIAGKDDMGGTAANRLTGITGSVYGSNLGATGGEQSHVLTISEMPSHNHTSVTIATVTNYANGLATGNYPSSGNTGLTGGDGSHNNVQPTIIMNKIIKFASSTSLATVYSFNALSSNVNVTMSNVSSNLIVDVTNFTNIYKFRAYLGAQQSLTASGFTDIQFNTKDYDLNTNFNTTTFSYVAPKTGYYSISATVEVNINSTTTPPFRLWARLLLNGGNFAGATAPGFEINMANANNFQSLTINDTVFLTANDAVRVNVYNGGNQAQTTNVSGSYFSAYLINASVPTAISVSTSNYTTVNNNSYNYMGTGNIFTGQSNSNNYIPYWSSNNSTFLTNGIDLATLDTLTGVQTLTNKTISSVTNTVTACCLFAGISNTVFVNGGSIPTSNQILTAINGSNAIWKNSGSTLTGTTTVSVSNLSNPYRFRVRPTSGTNQTINDATTTVVTQGTKSYDINNNISGNNYTVPVTGYYHIEAGWGLTNPQADKRVTGRIMYNTSNVAMIVDTICTGANTVYYTITGSDTILFNSGDVLFQDFYQNNGAAKTIESDRTWWTMSLVVPSVVQPLTFTGSPTATASPTVLNISNPYKFKVNLSTAQSYATATFITLNFNTIIYDTNSNINTSTFTYTVPISGIYHFDCFVSVNAPVPDIRHLVRLRKNGADTTIFDTNMTGDSSTNKSIVGGSDTILLVAGDTMILDYYQNTGATKTVPVIGTWWAGYLVCPTTPTNLTVAMS